jgi:PPK2 family polyphosphate:nucleotide phosphotransferase
MAVKVPSGVVLSELVVAPKHRPDLADRDTAAVPGVDLSKKDAPAALAERTDELELLQQRLFAEGRRALLVVLQGVDTSGKDGAIKNVFRGITPSATEVVGFKVPTTTELAHDYLWRIHGALPTRGRIGIFNRSHYEDVVATRVRGSISTSQVRKRYRHIRDFERMLGDEGTRIVKIFLHLSKDEQKERLQARLDDPEKRWKFRIGDLEDRARWDDFRAAYEDAIEATTTADAPWYVVPADKKWLRDVVVAEIVTSALADMDPELPPDDPELTGIVIR